MSEVPGNVLEAVRKEAREGKMPCSKALELARQLQVDPSLVGRALDLLEIRIISCQLGCF